MKNIFNIMSATSFAGVYFIGMTAYANMTRQARIDENRVHQKGQRKSLSINTTLPTAQVKVGNK